MFMVPTSISGFKSRICMQCSSFDLGYHSSCVSNQWLACFGMFHNGDRGCPFNSRCDVTMLIVLHVITGELGPVLIFLCLQMSKTHLMYNVFDFVFARQIIREFMLFVICLYNISLNEGCVCTCRHLAANGNFISVRMQHVLEAA